MTTLLKVYMRSWRRLLISDVCVWRAGVLSQAPAPAPLAQKPNTVNGLFVTTAASITFVNESTLALAGVPTSTEWVKFPPQPAASALPQVSLHTSLVLCFPTAMHQEAVCHCAVG